MVKPRAIYILKCYITILLTLSAFLLSALVSGKHDQLINDHIFFSEISDHNLKYYFRSRGSAKGKDSEYENMESDVPDDDDKAPLNMSRDSEQREIDEFEEEERRLLAEEEKVNKLDSRLWKVFLFLLTFTTRENQ